jgi:hypothetical protein
MDDKQPDRRRGRERTITASLKHNIASTLNKRRERTLRWATASPGIRAHGALT